ncbi:unnamed protein product [Pleuronectes platessa]|uniref:Uncharacterized protein n=1 Tax=Pleuronectes platessa TaxID=8262 RepID=A0A9N7YL65_PLEPL|nr:unnamed protein product [Pleuronectes platessa]
MKEEVKLGRQGDRTRARGATAGEQTHTEQTSTEETTARQGDGRRRAHPPRPSDGGTRRHPQPKGTRTHDRTAGHTQETTSEQTTKYQGTQRAQQRKAEGKRKEHRGRSARRTAGAGRRGKKDRRVN